MHLPSWLRPLAARLNRPAPRRARPRRAFRPSLEALEDRLTPSGGGLLDPTFNGTGAKVLSSSIMHVANDVAVQPDGKIVSVGYIQTGKQLVSAIQVVRMNPDGTLDTTFNGSGTATLSFGTGAVGEAVALQPDGKILVGGNANASKSGLTTDIEFVVARLNANGTLDSTFGNTGRKGVGGGIWAYNASSTATEFLRALAVVTDSSNHLTGIMVGGQLGGAFEAIKLTQAGVMDTTFGTGGDAVISIDGGVQNVGAMAVTPSGGVFMVGSAQYGEIVALTPTGQLDTSFNGTGYRVDNISGAAFTYFDAVAVQPTASGYRLVVAGTAYLNDPNRSGLVVAYTSGGAFDSTFATGGVFLAPTAGEFTHVRLEADGSIVVAGYAYWTDSSGQVWQQVAVGHLFADGSADTTFGTAGTGISLLTPLYGNGENAYSLAIDPAGRIVVTFETGANSNEAALARLTAP